MTVEGFAVMLAIVVTTAQAWAVAATAVVGGVLAVSGSGGEGRVPTL